VRDLAATVDTKLVTACDVRSDDDLDRVFAEASDAFGGGLDVLVHSVNVRGFAHLPSTVVRR
jgi:enoyl-[acyl-carrier-protein] reductase (NADH)